MFSTGSNLTKLTRLAGRDGNDELPDDTFVSLYNGNVFICGGIFVSKLHIIFLAQCTFGIIPVSNVLVISKSMGSLPVEDIAYNNNENPMTGLVIVSNSIKIQNSVLEFYFILVECLYNIVSSMR